MGEPIYHWQMCALYVNIVPPEYERAFRRIAVRAVQWDVTVRRKRVCLTAFHPSSVLHCDHHCDTALDVLMNMICTSLCMISEHDESKKLEKSGRVARVPFPGSLRSNLALLGCSCQPLRSQSCPEFTTRVSFYGHFKPQASVPLGST
jgi:hypothetical protein